MLVLQRLVSSKEEFESPWPCVEFPVEPTEVLLEQSVYLELSKLSVERLQSFPG